MRPSSRLSSACLLALGSFFWLPAQAVDVGVSISVSQPGVYGRIDIGRFPAPVLMQTEYVLVQPMRQRVEPVYLWVPPGHQKNWRKHCSRYQACGVPVYFVQEDWYQQNVMRSESSHPGKGHGKNKDKGHGKNKDRD
jgi:hypothetical protein